MLPTMLEHNRKQAGWSVGRAAWELGVSIREYRELEAGRSITDRTDTSLRQCGPARRRERFLEALRSPRRAG